MSTPKTQENNASVKTFLTGVANETRRKDSRVVLKLMRAISGNPAKMWGPSIIGFGKHHYQYANGKPGEICKIGFSPRASSLVFYLGSFEGRKTLLNTLGKHKMSKGGCLYVNKLEDISVDVLSEIINKAWEHSSST